MKIYALVLLSFLFSTEVFSACPRCNDNKPCKGECGAFTDYDKNGICDEWEKNKPQNITENKETFLSKQYLPPTINENKPKEKEKTFTQRISKYGLDKTIIAILFAIVLCEILKKKSAYKKIHRDLFNSILFLSFFSCALSGIFLYFSFFPDAKHTLFKIHLLSGFISFFVGIYHYLERFRCMFPFSKCQ